MTTCPCSFHRILLKRAQRRDPSVDPGPSSLLPHDPGWYIILDRPGLLLCFQFFVVGCDRPSHMLADAACMSHIAKAVLPALASTGETMLKREVNRILNNAVLVALAALIFYEVEVFAGCQVKYLGAFRDLLRSNVADVCCDLFNSCHFRKSFQNWFVLFTDIMIPRSIVYVKAFKANL